MDELARELDVVIVVAAGNRYPEIPSGQTTTAQFQMAVLRQTLNPEHRICNPATSAIALTVGSIARNDALAVDLNGRVIQLPDAFAGAPKDAPSPFTRTGPGCTYKSDNAPIKPELVDYGGNMALQDFPAAGQRWNKNHILLGEPVIQREENGRYIGSQVGTSFACPHVTHAAAHAQHILTDTLRQEPSANLIRALVASTAHGPEIPESWADEESARLRIVGYGQAALDDILWSQEGSVRIFAMDQIEEDSLHIYQIPLPFKFVSASGAKGIQVALAFDPPVRSSRKKYLACTMWVDVFKSLTLDQVEKLKSAKIVEGVPSVPTSSQLKLRPPLTDLQWSTLQVRRLQWRASPRWAAGPDGTVGIHVVVCCQQRFKTGLDSKQGYGLVVNLWHKGENINIYEPLKARLRTRVRTRITA